jgi:hypothetical protein
MNAKYPEKDIIITIYCLIVLTIIYQLCYQAKYPKEGTYV